MQGNSTDDSITTTTTTEQRQFGARRAIARGRGHVPRGHVQRTDDRFAKGRRQNLTVVEVAVVPE